MNQIVNVYIININNGDYHMLNKLKCTCFTSSQKLDLKSALGVLMGAKQSMVVGYGYNIITIPLFAVIMFWSIIQITRFINSSNY